MNDQRVKQALHWTSSDSGKSERPRIRWRDTILKDINPMNVTWDDICHIDVKTFLRFYSLIKTRFKRFLFFCNVFL